MCTDVSGLINPTVANGERYFISFTDIASRFSFVIELRTRAHVLKSVTSALGYAKNAHGQVHAIIHLDNAKKYLSHATIEAAESLCTVLRYTIPYNHEENGFAERINITNMNWPLTILAAAHMPDKYWTLAVSDITFKHALMMNASTGKIRFQMWKRNIETQPRIFIFGQLGSVPTCATATSYKQEGHLHAMWALTI